MTKAEFLTVRWNNKLSLVTCYCNLSGTNLISGTTIRGRSVAILMRQESSKCINQ